MKKTLLILANLLIISQLSFTQSVTIMPINPASPTKGTMVYDNVTNQLQYWNNSAWIPITNAASGTGWTLSGNHIFNNNTGNVGIGTSNPYTTLHVKSTSNSPAIFEGPANMFIPLLENGLYRGYIGSYQGNPEDIDFGTYSGNTTGSLHLATNSIPRLTVDPLGKIGIGITNPQATLHVNPNGTGSILIGANKNAGGYTNLEMGITAQSGGDADVQSISNSGSSYGSLLLNLFGGNVGIGTASTTQKLTVAGNTAISGTIDVGSNAAIVGNITVNSGKGIVRSNDGTQLKTILFQTPNNIILTNFMNGSVGIVPMVFSTFSAPPTISVGNTEGILNADNLLITVTNVTNSSATMVVRHVGTQVVASTNGIIHAIIIGPQ